MIHHAQAIIRRVAGVLLVLLGIVGLLMPILPGWLFLIPGAVLLGFDVPKMVRLLAHLEERYPRCGRVLGALRRRLHRYHTGENREPPLPDAPP
ncbi:MAG TPA: hypothetical protein VIK18_00790 [Pirellulales bacterium]